MINRTLDIMERRLRLERGLVAKQDAVEKAQLDMEATPLGWKRSVASQILQEAKGALQSQLNEITALKDALTNDSDKRAQIAELEARAMTAKTAVTMALNDLLVVPVEEIAAGRVKLENADTIFHNMTDEIERLKGSLIYTPPSSLTYFLEQVAIYRVNLSILEKRIEAATELLAAAVVDAKKDAWKWQARKDVPEPKAVVDARAVLALLEEEKVILAAGSATALSVVDEAIAFNEEKAELTAWVAGGEKPAWAEAAEEAWRKELQDECVLLVRRSCTSAVVSAEDEDDIGWGVPMSAEERLEQLRPKDPVVAVAEPVPFRSSAPSRGPTSDLCRRMIEVRAARAAAAAAAVIV